jgi:universal stress protein A
MGAIKTLLVPTDFAPPSTRALGYACELADALGARLHILHVVEDPLAPGAFMEMYTPLPGDYRESLEREAAERLAVWVTPEQQARYSPVLATRVGTPAQQILEYVEEHPAIDLVVMATAGRGGVARLVMGSVADRLLRTAPCPVLTLHPSDRPHVESSDRAA